MRPPGEVDAGVGEARAVLKFPGGLAAGVLCAAVGEDLQAAGPMGQKREGLLVVEGETVHAHGIGQVVLGGYRVIAVGRGLEAVEVEKLGRRG